MPGPRFGGGPAAEGSAGPPGRAVDQPPLLTEPEAGGTCVAGTVVILAVPPIWDVPVCNVPVCDVPAGAGAAGAMLDLPPVAFVSLPTVLASGAAAWPADAGVLVAVEDAVAAGLASVAGVAAD